MAWVSFARPAALILAVAPCGFSGPGDPGAEALLSDFAAMHLDPVTATVTSGATQYHTLAQKWDGSSVPAPRVVFSASAGHVDASGLYTAPPVSGAQTVTARLVRGRGLDLAAEASVAVLSAVPASELYPNRPAELQTLADIRFDAPLPHGWSCGLPGMVAGCWYQYTDRVTIVNDPTAPVNHGRVLQYTWPAGLRPGTSGGPWGGWGGRGMQPQVARYYEAGWFKIAGADLEGPGAGQQKLLGYWGVDSYNAAVYSALEPIHGRPTGRTGKQSNSVIAAEWTLDIRQQLDGVFTSMRPNVGRQPIIAGKWFRYEILMELNSMVSGETRSDGKLRVWLTNVSDRGRAILTHSYDNVKWRTAKHPGGFSERHWNPIWGGKGPVRKTREDRLLVDHVYIAGAGRP
jgi:hypothetical protein